jgi:mannose-6-phosphate isomerase-like protein (cupin superfamily)
MKYFRSVPPRPPRPGRVRLADAHAIGLAAALIVFAGAAAHAQTPETQTPATQTPATQTPATQAPAKPRPAKPAAAAPTLSIDVTDRSGESLVDVAVAVTGPVDRSGTTTEKGAVVFRGMRPGTYRLRFEHEDFVSLERDVVMTAKPATLSVALTPLPEPAAPLEPSEAPDPPDTAGRPPRDIAPRTLSIPDFLDKNLIGGEPQRTTLLACADGGTARLLQIRDPLEDQQHAGLDEILYIVAGAGVLRIDDLETKLTPGFFALVPRGMTHSMRRQGRNPLIALSVLTGEPCEEDGDR